MNRPVKKAWIVQNSGHNMLYVQFEEPYNTTDNEWYPPNNALTALDMPVARYEDHDGIIEYGVFVKSASGKSFWFNKPALGAFNAMVGINFANIVEVIASDRHKAFPALRSRVVTVELANEILRQFDLPFDLIFVIGGPGDGTSSTPIYVPHEDTIKIGQTVTHTKEGECIVQQCMFDSRTGNAHIAAHPVNDVGHLIWGTFEDFPDAYKGITYQQFMDEWHRELYHGA